MADLLLSRYLDTFESVFPILDDASFRSEYEHFWSSHDDLQSPIWMATLSVVMHLGLLVTPTIGRKSIGIMPEWASFVQNKTAHVVELFTHLKSQTGRLSIDILRLQCLNTVVRLVDGSKSFVAWKLAGTLMQASTLFGLHEQPSSHVIISSDVDANNRRSLWSTIAEVCLHASRAASLPISIPASQIFDLQRTPCNSTDTLAQGLRRPLGSEFRKSMEETLPYRLNVAMSSYSHIGSSHVDTVFTLPCQVNHVQEMAACTDKHSTMTIFQSVAYSMIQDASTIRVNLVALRSSQNHDLHQMVHPCRSILEKLQNPSLSAEERFLVHRLFRSDILTSILCLLLYLRQMQHATGAGAVDGSRNGKMKSICHE